MTLKRPQDLISAEGDGAKSYSLHQLKKAGFNVPEFVVLPPTTLAQLHHKELSFSELSQSIETEIGDVGSYAVRSNALIEDLGESSMAGQFMTLLDVSMSEIEDAIKTIYQDASTKCKVESQFSIIIQSYITPDISGVCFTRSPNGGHKSILEYHEGSGDALVSGEIKPKQVFFSLNQKPQSLPNSIQKHLNQFSEIEKLFSAPQDIEWCLKDGEFFALQSRPVTTLTREDFEKMLIIDETIDGTEDYFLEKTEISEMVPRPTPLALSFIEKLYAQDGPIAKTYRKFGIHYHKENQFEVVGNELYVNKEQELASVLPGYSYFTEKKGTPSKNKFSFTALKNILFLGALPWRVSSGRVLKRLNKLNQKLIEFKNDSKVEDSIEKFLKDYQLIFEINLFAFSYQKLFETFLKTNNLEFTDIVHLQKLLLLRERPILPAGLNPLTGNSVDLSSLDPFVTVQTEGQSQEPSEKWKQLPRSKRQYLQKKIRLFFLLQEARELGRWLTVLNKNNLRKNLEKIHGASIDFYTLDELKSDSRSESQAKERQRHYERFAHYTLPTHIESFELEKSHSQQFAYPGSVEGEMITTAELKKLQDNGKLQGNQYVLLTQNLSPDLAMYIPYLCGIIAERGGSLSHMAILAREAKLTTLIGFDLKQAPSSGTRVSLSSESEPFVKIIS